MELASLNCKNDIDVIVNQFFRELTKRWMLLQNKTEDCSLVRDNLRFYVCHNTGLQSHSNPYF